MDFFMWIFFLSFPIREFSPPAARKASKKGVKMGLIYFMVKYTPAITNIFFPYLFVSGEKDVFSIKITHTFSVLLLIVWVFS